MKTINIVLDFFSDGRYKILLQTHTSSDNVWIAEDGTLTICFTEDDVKTFNSLPRVYQDIDNLNKKRLAEKKLSVDAIQFHQVYSDSNDNSHNKFSAYSSQKYMKFEHR